MPIIKYISTIILITVILGNITIFAGENDYNQTENIIACSEKEGFQLYVCEYKNVCKNQEFGKNKDKIVNFEKNFFDSPDFEEASEIYKVNQNVIYKCGILNSQDRAFNELIITLTNASDKTGILKTKIIPKIEGKLKVIRDIKDRNNCNTINSSQYDRKSLNKITLDQSTLELCNYKYYLKFLEEREDNDLKNSFPEGAESISSKEAGKIINEKKSKIQNEIEHSIKMYPLAYETYSQYDNFIKIHIILELLKEDYRALRNKLYQTLHPINQVVYKIINAQSK